ncbi:glycoside hydrolase family 97 protein [Reichenbachiella sp. MSK19-1]|uniref:glycoside hydrolase family 97 protein n=1 Tax=Reichenbachiella sp. MSK19-1 TaxID=1897631 RepID=UPI000E6C5364|nr:glycoside hydrolase family 97 protein [Reichenbachiella sp. MSK19-1]RJE74521.1 alpha-glucosidase [Reichenbachiella sp. MSK19-1]
MKRIVLVFFISSIIVANVRSQRLELKSPNQKNTVGLWKDLEDQGRWFLRVEHMTAGARTEILPRIDLGLITDKTDFSKGLRWVKSGKVREVRDDYKMLHGKKAHRQNVAKEVTVQFQLPDKSPLNVVIRAYNDGVTFRYVIPEIDGDLTVKEEMTAYTIPDSTRRWLQKFNPANEGYYRSTVASEEQQDWAYPALFQSPDSACFYLLHEADLGRDYCGTKLTNYQNKNEYKLSFPDDWNGRGQGQPEPVISEPWHSPWRVIIIGSLADIVESTLVEDVSEPNKLENTDWIKLGLVSWNYWSNNHGTKDYQIVTEFADLAAQMGWPYTLLDWEWDAMTNGGNLDDALAYIHSKGVKPLIWYNSGGDHTWVAATPKDRMLTHENRVAEFKKLKEKGIAGVKVDFFESEKQDMINYYLDIIEDAAEYEIMVYFHGCLVPRGWQRTYPHLMTYEGVRGAEWYNNRPDFTFEAPEHNTILPFTRNVVGSMDYTPITFTNSQHPHITSYGHELALGVLFESAFQHLADRPDGYQSLPFEAKDFLSDLPVAWDETKLLDGFPGRDVTIARKKEENWYIGGINGEDKSKSQTLSLDFLAADTQYKLTLIADGAHDKKLSTKYLIVDRSDSLDIKMLRRGGFVVSLIPVID